MADTELLGRAVKGEPIDSLRFFPGDLIAMHCPAYNVFLLGRATRIATGMSWGEGMMGFIFNSEAGIEEYRTLMYNGRLLELGVPYQAKGKPEFVPNVTRNLDAGPDRPFEFNAAYSGNEGVKNGFLTTPGFELYAGWMDMGRLVTERGKIGKLAQKLRIDALLPGLPRISRIPGGRAF